MLKFLFESPRYLLNRKKYNEAFEKIDYIREGSNKNLLTEIEKTKIKEKVESLSVITIDYKLLFHDNYRSQTIYLWVIWFVVNYIFYGVIYLIPELLGKTKENISYKNLINAVVFSTIFEIIGILCTYINEIKIIGRLGSFRISFIVTCILCAISLFMFTNSNYFLHLIKGSIQIATRSLYIYSSEAYPTGVRGTMLGYSNVVTRIASLITPMVHESLMYVSPRLSLVSLGLSSLIGFFASMRLKVETLNKNIE